MDGYVRQKLNHGASLIPSNVQHSVQTLIDTVEKT